MLQIIKQTKEEKMAMYMKLPKKELVEMLVNCNDIIESLMQEKNNINQNENVDNTCNTVNLAFKKIKKALKTGIIYICPKCNNITEFSSNPLYYWKCETCGHEGNYRLLKFKTVKNFFYDVLSKLMQEKNNINQNQNVDNTDKKLNLSDKHK